MNNFLFKKKLWEMYGDKKTPSEWDGIGGYENGGKISQRFWEYFKIIDISNFNKDSIVLDIGGGSPGFFKQIIQEGVGSVDIIDPSVNEEANYSSLKRWFSRKKYTHIVCISVLEHIEKDVNIEIIKAIDEFFSGDVCSFSFEFHPKNDFFKGQLTTGILSDIFSNFKNFYVDVIEKSPIACVNSFNEIYIPQWYPLVIKMARN
jgi:hypothetical protein